MWRNAVNYYNGYSQIGDLIVLGSCISFMMLIKFSYMKKSKPFQIYKMIIHTLMFSAIFRVNYYSLLNRYAGGENISVLLIKLLRFASYGMMFTTLFLFFVYMLEPLHIEHWVAMQHLKFLSLFLFFTIGYGVYEVIKGYNIERIGLYTNIKENNTVYFVMYFVFVALIAWMLFYYRKRIFKQIILGVGSVCIISLFFIIVQYLHNSVSYTLATFLFPLFALLYMIHANPYDIEIGTVDNKAFYTLINDCKKTGHGLIFAQIYFPAFEKSTMEYPDNLRSDIRDLFNKHFKQIILFQISAGRIVLTADYSKNPNVTTKMSAFFEEFDRLLSRAELSYKLIALKSKTVYTRANDYMGVFKYSGSLIQDNTCHLITEGEEKAYFDRQKILKELEDISNKGDINDERIIVYCQPVFNIQTQCYDTAEALMRLLPPLDWDTNETVITPDRFIALSEKHGYIHHMGFVMLNKVCQHIKELRKRGCKINRISVNFSVSDFRSSSFVSDILEIIQNVGISEDSIAIEITETQNEKDFYILKDKMTELKKHGIKFYLDDFGTGYSNYERIMELPFDIIKFDRSLVTACSLNNKSEIMVKNMAKMFCKMHLSVLYEGIETEQDIQKCTNMNGEYLQGFHYSKPLPIKEMEQFFEKE